MEPQIQYAKTSDGVSIAFAVAGSGPPLVYVRMWTAWHVQLDWQGEYEGKLYEALAANRTLVTFDRRGAGLSDRGVSELTLEKFTLDLEAVVDQLGLERFARMGWAFGMMVSTIYALRHPKRVSAIISLNGVVSGSAFWQSPRNRAMRAMRETDFDTYVETMASRNRDPRMSEIWRASITPEGQKAFVDASDMFDVTDLVSQLNLPVLLLYPADGRDAAAIGAFARGMATRIPGGRLVALPWESWEAFGERVVSAVDAFLNDALGDQPPPTARSEPSLMRTILFTDIVGHTEMMQRLGDAKGRVVLREHERITREALLAHGGVEVKTDGDSFMASFASVSAAVECAVALQRAFAAYSETTGEPIVVRMGLNVGEPIEEDGDYFGSAVILGARIKDQAGAGEILVPEAVRHLLSGKPFLFSDRGVVDLKGFEDPVRLYEVRWQADERSPQETVSP
jgi:class 3 adenylate cyclase